MDETTKHKALLEEVLQPRNDYLGIEAIKPLLVQSIESYWSGRPDDCSFRPPTDPSVRD